MRETSCCTACVLSPSIRCSIGRGITAVILEICPHGVRVEIRTPVRPSHPCMVTVRFSTAELHLGARVAWCQVATSAAKHASSPSLRYHAHLEFTELDEAEAARLVELLALAVRPDTGHTRREIA